MAIGIVSFAFVGVLGLIPTGLNASRQAMDVSVGSQIAQRVINEAQQTDFSVLTSATGTNPRYFDEQGNEVTAADPHVIYWVNTQIKPATSIPCTSGTNGSLATVTIQVANNPGKRTINPGNSGPWSDSRFPMFTTSALVSESKPQ